MNRAPEGVASGTVEVDWSPGSVCELSTSQTGSEGGPVVRTTTVDPYRDLLEPIGRKRTEVPVRDPTRGRRGPKKRGFTPVRED